MARRYHEIKGLAEYTAKTIVSDEEQWSWEEVILLRNRKDRVIGI